MPRALDGGGVPPKFSRLSAHPVVTPAGSFLVTLARNIWTNQRFLICVAGEGNAGGRSVPRRSNPTRSARRLRRARRALRAVVSQPTTVSSATTKTISCWNFGRPAELIVTRGTAPGPDPPVRHGDRLEEGTVMVVVPVSDLASPRSASAPLRKPSDECCAAKIGSAGRRAGGERAYDDRLPFSLAAPSRVRVPCPHW